MYDCVCSVRAGDDETGVWMLPIHKVATFHFSWLLITFSEKELIQMATNFDLKFSENEPLIKFYD